MALEENAIVKKELLEDSEAEEPLTEDNQTVEEIKKKLVFASQAEFIKEEAQKISLLSPGDVQCPSVLQSELKSETSLTTGMKSYLQKAMEVAAEGMIVASQRAAEIDQQYKITEQTKSAVDAGMKKAKEIDEQYAISNTAKATATKVTRRATLLGDEVTDLSKVAATVVSEQAVAGMESASTMATQLEEQYKITESTKAAMNMAEETANLAMVTGNSAASYAMEAGSSAANSAKEAGMTATNYAMSAAVDVKGTAKKAATVVAKESNKAANTISTKATELDEHYSISNKAKAAATVVSEQASQLNDQYKVTETISSVANVSVNTLNKAMEAIKPKKAKNDISEEKVKQLGEMMMLGGVKMSETMLKEATELFDKMDENNDDIVTLKEASKHFSVKKFGKVNAIAMFSEVDDDVNNEITKEEWIDFWQQVLDHGYTENDITEELINMKNSEAWVDWEDGRTTEKNPEN